MNAARGILVVWCLFAAGPELRAQWNAVAGYEVSSADAGAVNQVLQAFNTDFGPTVPLTDIRVLHGFTAGLRYKYPLGAFEMVYSRRFTRRIGDHFNIDRGSIQGITDVNFFYEIRTFSLITEFGRTVTTGASLDYNTYHTEMDYVTASFHDVKIKQRPLGSRFFMGVHLANRPNLSFSVRAFYQTLWTDLSTRQLRQDLQLEESTCETCHFRPSTFGLSIIINNGRQ